MPRRLDRRRVPRGDRRGIDAGRQRAVVQAGVAGQARGAEGVGDRRRRVAHEQRALQAQRHALHHAARARLDRLQVRELRARGGGEGIEARIAASIEVVSDRVSQVSSAVDQIAGGAAQVSTDMVEVVTVAEQSSATAQQVSASAEQTSASTQQIAASAHELSRTAHELDALVGRFTL